MTLPACSWCGEPGATAMGWDGDAECADDAACARRMSDAARDPDMAAIELAAELANALDTAHRPTHPEAIESCDVCRLLERARRWAR